MLTFIKLFYHENVHPYSNIHLNKVNAGFHYQYWSFSLIFFNKLLCMNLYTSLAFIRWVDIHVPWKSAISCNRVVILFDHVVLQGLVALATLAITSNARSFTRLVWCSSKKMDLVYKVSKYKALEFKEIMKYWNSIDM